MYFVTVAFDVGRSVLICFCRPKKSQSFGAEDCFIGKKTEVRREGKFLTYIYFCNQFMAEEGLRLTRVKCVLGSASNKVLL